MEKEIKRQLFHCGVGLSFVGLVYIGWIQKIGTLFPFNRLFFLPALARPLFVFLIVGAPFIPLAKRCEIPGVEWLLDNFERQQACENFPGKGAFFFTLGALINALFFERTIVLASILILTLADSTSNIIGRKFGKVTHPISQEKKIEGQIVGAIVSGVSASLFVNPAFVFTASFTAMFIEGVHFGAALDWYLDDNLLIPLVSGASLFLLQVFCG